MATEPFSSERIERELIVPLTRIIADLTEACRGINSAHQAGLIEHDWLPFNYVGAANAIKDLQYFVNSETKPKTATALGGTFKYRATELAFFKRQQADAAAKETEKQKTE